jgi:hypothetical protein
MAQKEYNLDMHEALDVLLSGGAVKGKDFAKGIFIKLNSYGHMVIVDANDFYTESNAVSLSSLSSQKFREVSVFTLKELSE